MKNEMIEMATTSTDLNMFLGEKEDYLTAKDKKEIRFQGLVERLKQDGLSECEAINKARVLMFQPKKLIKEKYFDAERKAGIRPSVTFFFDNDAEGMYLRKFFKINLSGQVKNCNELLKILKFYDENAVQPENRMVHEYKVRPKAVPVTLLKDIREKKQRTLEVKNGKILQQSENNQ